MLNCPHCDRPGIGLWAKFFATPADPAVCRHCASASSISSAIISASTLLYFFAGFVAFGFVAVYMMHGSPSPAMTLMTLGVFFIAIESLKLFWVPMQALTTSEVKKKQGSGNRFYIGAFIVLACLTLLGQCGY